MPAPNRWIRFLIRAEDTAGATSIRARFWDDGSPEPESFMIDAIDATSSRLTAGRIGIWSDGGLFVDDLSAHSSAPSISFVDVQTGQTLDAIALALFKRPARITVLAPAGFSATLDGTPFESGSEIRGEGVHALTVTAGGRQATLRLLIDTAPPVIALKADGIPFADGQSFDHPVVVSAEAADVSSVMLSATLDGAPVTLPRTVAEERPHELRVAAVDQVAWESAATGHFTIESAGPVVQLLAPAADACINATAVEVSGRVAGSDIRTVQIALGSAAPLSASVAADGSFAATVPAPAEGRFILAVDAADSRGRAASARIALTIDRSAPALEITSSGTPFSGGAFNRPVSLFLTPRDADRGATVEATVNGQPYESGTPLTGEGTYRLNAVAHDCAGNVSPEAVLDFMLDFTPPRMAGVEPADGSSVETAYPAIHGTVDADDLKSVTIEQIAVTAVVNGRTFAFNGVDFAEGINRLTLVFADRAGNISRVPYALDVKSRGAAVAIVENGSPIPSDALFNRTVVPVIRSSDPDATITATLNGAAFTSGTEVTADGSYVLTASGLDSLGHASGPVTATFSIDRTPPILHIENPADGAIVTADHADVRGTATGADSVSINGAAVPLTGSRFAASVPLESGANLITVMASDRAGNDALDQVEITRDDGAGIILTLPADSMLTNRTAVTVAGQVLAPSPDVRVEINGAVVAVDPAGAFRLPEFALVEGTNAITASIAGTSSSTTALVIADFTPPRLVVQANGSDLRDGGRLPADVEITLAASDERPGVTTTATLDGVRNGEAV
ncbi:MAG TPA: hypothetical protein VKH35_03995, partial [Thermoanaerobaculia bacterium]|nr:hypothetical protein [Thermoanaerobaculia bacterium]